MHWRPGHVRSERADRASDGGGKALPDQIDAIPNLRTWRIKITEARREQKCLLDLFRRAIFYTRSSSDNPRPHGSRYPRWEKGGQG